MPRNANNNEHKHFYRSARETNEGRKEAKNERTNAVHVGHILLVDGAAAELAYTLLLRGSHMRKCKVFARDHTNSPNSRRRTNAVHVGHILLVNGAAGEKVTRA